MNRILSNLTSRKFLTVLTVQVASVCAIFAPELEGQIADAGMRIVGLVVLVVAALGYGKIEGAVDRERMAAQADIEKTAMTLPDTEEGEDAADTDAPD
jgi:hypothetical protein